MRPLHPNLHPLRSNVRPLHSIPRSPQSVLRPRRPVPLLALLALILAALLLLVLLRFPARVPAARGQAFLGSRPIGPAEVTPQGVILLPLETVREHFDPAIRWVGERKKIQTSVSPWRLHMTTEAATRFVREEAVVVEFPSPSGTMVPIEILCEIYGISLRVMGEKPGVRVLIDWAERDIPLGRNSAPITLRSRPWPWWPGTRLPAGSTLSLYDRVGKWWRVRTEDGQVGYVPEGAVDSAGSYRVEAITPPRPVVPGRPVCLTWEHVVRPGLPDVGSLAPLPGVNVVSPTWLHIEDTSGSLSSACDVAYVRWAHAQGYAVWVLVGNDFDPDLTRRVLRDQKARDNLIRQLLVYCRLFHLDGINVDFENVYLSEKESFAAFVEELAALARAEGLTVSVDITVKSTSPTWSLFLDRARLARAADFLALMAYDEHYAGSRAGSVASLPWVEKGIIGVLEEVPPRKLLLGIPFYTRLWKEERAGGQVRTTSRALGMGEIESMLAEKGIEPGPDRATGQDHAQWSEGGATYRVWLENERSIRARLDLVKKYGLAGVASWRRGFEKPSVWEVISTGLGR